MESLTFQEEIVPVEMVEISDTLVQMYSHYSKMLTATVYPEEARSTKIIWTTSDSTVVKVGKDGRITGSGTFAFSYSAKVGNYTYEICSTSIMSTIK
jgi:hypothetical protein